MPKEYIEEMDNKISENDVNSWFDSEEEEDSSTETVIQTVDLSKKFTSAQLKIVRSSMDLSLYNLRHSLKDSSYINLSPKYQRRHRWDLRKKSLLIESFLMNIPIPPIFLFENTYNQYEVMDGRQRLEAIDEFLNNNYFLRGLEYWPELNGSRFNELPHLIQKGLLRRTLSAIVLLAETSRPDESEIDVRMALFNRLNTGGIKLNPQELRNALYPSLFNELLIRLSHWDLFREIWGIPKYTEEELTNPSKELMKNALYRTMADCEIVLRYFSIKDIIENNLTGALRKIMDRTMTKYAKLDRSQLDRLAIQYEENLQALYNVFDGKPFRLNKNNRLSRPLYDALMVASADLDKTELLKRKRKIQTSLSEALNDKDKYEILVGRGNTISSIKERVELAKKILLG